MFFFYALLSGVVISVMNVINSELSLIVGSFLSTVIIHLAGLITMIIILLVKKQPVKFQKDIPFPMYLGGVVGILTVIFTALSLPSTGAALVTALCLIGQILASLILERKGWLGVPKVPFSKSKLIGLVVIICGIGVMIW